MSSTTIKHESFIREPLGEKLVSAIPGVGPVLGGRLNAKGYNTARQLYEKVVQIKFNPLEFKEWFMSVCGANKKQASDCYEALYDWHNSFGNRSRTSDAAKSLDDCDNLEENFRCNVHTNDDATKDFFMKSWKTVDKFPHSLQQQVLQQFREILNKAQRSAEKADKYSF